MPFKRPTRPVRHGTILIEGRRVRIELPVTISDSSPQRHSQPGTLPTREPPRPGGPSPNQFTKRARPKTNGPVSVHRPLQIPRSRGGVVNLVAKNIGIMNVDLRSVGWPSSQVHSRKVSARSARKYYLDLLVTKAALDAAIGSSRIRAFVNGRPITLDEVNLIVIPQAGNEQEQEP